MHEEVICRPHPLCELNKPKWAEQLKNAERLRTEWHHLQGSVASLERKLREAEEKLEVADSYVRRLRTDVRSVYSVDEEVSFLKNPNARGTVTKVVMDRGGVWYEVEV